MEKSRSNKAVGELMVNGKRFTHPDFLTGLVGNSVNDVVSLIKRLSHEWFTENFLESNSLAVRVSFTDGRIGNPQIVRID